MKLRPTKSAAPLALSIIGGIFGIGVGMFLAFFGGALKTLIDKVAEGSEVVDLSFLPIIGYVTLFASIAAIVGGSISKRTPVGGFILSISAIAVLVCELVMCDRCYLFKLAPKSSAIGIVIFWVLIPGILLAIGGLVAVCAAFMKDKTTHTNVPPQNQNGGYQQYPNQQQNNYGQPQNPQQPNNNQNSQQ